MTSSRFPLARRTGPATLVLAFSALLAACGGGGGGPPQFPPPEVSVATPVQKSVTEWDAFEGRIEATDAVEIRPRVGGYLAEVHFKEGATVDKGALLFTIDDREYRAAAATARAELDRAKARQALAQREFARSRKLVEARAVSQEELQGREAELAQAKADVAASKARLEQAELTLGFTRIRAPIAGRVGAALVKPGNLVMPNESLLTTVVSIDPVYVTFQGDERAYLRYQQLARDGGRPSSRDARNPVMVGLANEDGYPHSGEMVFVDNALNPATGTILARAELANPDGLFTPGLFARVRLLGDSRTDALLVHPQAILTDQDRRFVYVVGDDGHALRKDLQLGPEVDGLRVVESGLAATDRVVVNGSRKIFFPGQPVSPVEVPMTEPNQAPPKADAPPAAAPAAGEG